jgi:hypothetical protein
MSIAHGRQPDWYGRLLHAMALVAELEVLCVGQLDLIRRLPRVVRCFDISDPDVGQVFARADVRLYSSSVLTSCLTLADRFPGIVVDDGCPIAEGSPEARLCRRALATWTAPGSAAVHVPLTGVGLVAQLPSALSSAAPLDLFDSSHTLAAMADEVLGGEPVALIRRQLEEAVGDHLDLANELLRLRAPELAGEDGRARP